MAGTESGRPRSRRLGWAGTLRVSSAWAPVTEAPRRTTNPELGPAEPVPPVLGRPAEGPCPPEERKVDSPTKLPLRSWLRAIGRAANRVYFGELGIMSAGVALFAVIALVPAATAIITTYGLVADPNDIRAQLRPVLRLMPHDAAGLVVSQLERVASTSSYELGIAFATSLGLAVLSALSGVSALIGTLNVAYHERERRNYAMRMATAMALTVAGIIGVVVTTAAVVALPAVLRLARISGDAASVVALVRWPVLFGFLVVSLGVLYRYGPARPRPRWRWLSPGALLATVMWMAASILLSLYVERVADYRIYGAFGSAVVLLLWFYVSLLAIVTGAAVNAELELETCRDSARGVPAPVPRRASTAPDHVTGN